MQKSPGKQREEAGNEKREYVLGFVLSLVLTLPIFYAIVIRGYKGTEMACVAGLAALLQIAVHLRFFLQLRLKGQSREDLHMVIFTVLILILMCGGTLWILMNLSSRM